MNHQEVNHQEVNHQEVNHQEVNHQEVNYQEVNYRRNKILVVAMTVLMFVSQAIASAAVPFSIDAGSDPHTRSGDQMNDVTMAHSMNAMQEDNCCELDCDCPMSACTSASALMSVTPIIPGFYDSCPEFGSMLTTAPSQTPTSLYRPPISS